MYRVIIVDDEPMIRRGLRETIEWDSLGLEVAGEAADGVEALRLVRAIRPEILITDIRMPGMDGLELIQEVRKLNYEVKITILSGYSDYSYLKAAIRLGVDNYLLKPIDNDELISNLKNAVGEIEREAVIDLQIRQGSELLRSNTLRRLVNGNISAEELREKAEFLKLSLYAESYVCAVCSLSRQLPTDRREALFKALTEDAGEKLMPFIDADGSLALLAACDGSPDDRIQLQRTLELVVSRAAREGEPTLMIGVGQPVERLEDIPRAYQSAKESLEYGAFLKNSGVIWYDGVPEATLPVHAYDRIDMEKLKGFIRRGDPNGLKDYLDQELTAVTAEAAPSVNQVRNLLMHIAVRMTDCFRELYGGMNAFREPRDFDYAQLFTLRRFSDMRAWLFKLCDELFARNESVLGKSASVVGYALAYINQHYREGVTLKQVAAECHINTSYLGQVFHKETGSAFTDYVNALRIKEARRLLNNPTLKVYEVAEQVGFTDYHYFLKIFKKVTGITPSDLRN
ncbi:MAG: response regulator transcription factor [Clostridia bacterium]|nr:response regulator transcription factor [Clostridia bacterium]